MPSFANNAHRTQGFSKYQNSETKKNATLFFLPAFTHNKKEQVIVKKM